MNSMNATATMVVGTTSTNEQAQRSLAKMAKMANQKLRRRVSAIESPSDLLIDNKKDDLLSISTRDEKSYQNNLYEYEHITKHNESNLVYRFLYDTKKGFNYALELYNRSQCAKMNEIWKTHGPFYECKGALRVVQRMCTRCRDSDKPKTKTDLYYVDLTERIRERTILCHGCMGRVLLQHIGTDDGNNRKRLSAWRKKQRLGIVVLPKGDIPVL